MEEEILHPLLRRRLLGVQDDGVGGGGVWREAEQLHRGGLSDHQEEPPKTLHLHNPGPSGKFQNFVLRVRNDLVSGMLDNMKKDHNGDPPLS